MSVIISENNNTIQVSSIINSLDTQQSNNSNSSQILIQPLTSNISVSSVSNNINIQEEVLYAYKISDFNEAVDDRVNDLLVDGNYINLQYNDTNNTLQISVTGLQPSGVYLEELLDVNITGVDNGDFLQYSSANQKWIPSSTGTFTNLQVSGVFELYSSSVTGCPFILNIPNQNDDVGALKIVGSDPDIFLDSHAPGNGYPSSVTNLDNGVFKTAAGYNPWDDTYFIARYHNGTWYDNTFNINRSNGIVRIGTTLESFGINTGSLIISGGVAVGKTINASSGNFGSLKVNNTGVSLSGHTHTLSNITDLSNLNITYPQLSNSVNVSLNTARRVASAWINFDGTNIVSIRSSFNISSIVDNGVGDYTINFTVPFSNTNYTFVTWSRDYNTDNTIINNLGARSNTSKTASSIRLIFSNDNNAVNYDSPECNIIFFGA